MFLTMNIIENMLSDFKKDTRMSNASAHFSGVQIAEHQDTDSANIYEKDGHVEICHGSDIIFIYEKDIYSVVNRIISQMRNLEIWEKELFHLIFRGGTLQDMINYLQTLYSNAMFISDETDRIIARTNHPLGSVNSEWDNILTMVHMSFASTSLFRRFREANRSAYYREGKSIPTLLSPPGIESRGIQYRIHSPIDNSVLGLFVIIECDMPITLGQLNFSEIICDAIDEWVNMHQHDLPFKTGQDLFIQYMDQYDTIENHDIIYRFITKSDSTYIMSVIEGASKNDLKHIELYIDSIEIGCSYFYYHDDMVLIYSMEHGYEPLKSLQEYITYYYNVRIGTSYEFDNLEHLINNYRQAKLSLAYSTKQITRLDSKIVLDFFAHESAKEILGNGIIHPALSILKKYDNKHMTDYFETLYIFLRKERSLVETAKELHIHRNSIIYRIEKIQQLIDLDLDDPDIREYLLMSYRFWNK